MKFDKPLESNTILVYDIEYNRWWQDDYGVHSVAKGYPERIYAAVRGELFEMYVGDDDAGEPIKRVWKKQPIFQ